MIYTTKNYLIIDISEEGIIIENTENQHQTKGFLKKDIKTIELFQCNDSYFTIDFITSSFLGFIIHRVELWNKEDYDNIVSMLFSYENHYQIKY